MCKKSLHQVNLSRKIDIPCPIIVLRIGRSRRPQIAAPLEVKAIFRCSIRSLPVVLAITQPRSLGPGGVSSIVCPAGFHCLSPTFPPNASQHCARPLCSCSIAALTPILLTGDLRLAALYLLEDAYSETLRRQFSEERRHICK